ncbi:hypothetical protein HAX54_010300 [Datura stramonium]|uniref:Uncharacterized protein n=1 Tax=Datura stramonium TaxID=4076 RepID=A0ABS8WVU2_DATST|nr:hypothetical protein [Datura stramonium]
MQPPLPTFYFGNAIISVIAARCLGKNHLEPIGLDKFATIGVGFWLGKRVHMSPGIRENDGSCVILEGNEGDGSLTVEIVLQDAHMDLSKNSSMKEIQMLKRKSS